MSQNPQTPDAPLTNIFINYRRDDTRANAGRLEADLEKHFPGRVFRDIHDIEAGSDFVVAINDEVGKCGALLVMIGRQWLTLTDKNGKRRLDNPGDYVAAEIAGALVRKEVRVIPILVDDAQMPTEEDLPASLKDLVRRNARKLDDEYWDEDVKKLVAVLEKACGASLQPSTLSVKLVPKVAIVAGVSALVAALAVGIFLSTRKGSPQVQPQQFIAGPAPSPTAAATPVSPPKSPPDAPPRPLERQAVVNLAQNEAEFFFPFDTTGDKWTWFRKQSKLGADEYHWNVFVPGDYEYKITVFLEKRKDDAPGKGNFKSLLVYTDTGVKWRGPGEEFGAIDKKFPLEIERTPEPGGLRIKVKGAGVERMFAKQRPKEIALMTVTPDEEAESEITTDVEYK